MIHCIATYYIIVGPIRYNVISDNRVVGPPNINAVIIIVQNVVIEFVICFTISIDPTPVTTNNDIVIDCVTTTTRIMILMDTSAYRIFKKVIINLVVAGTTAKVNPVVLI